MKSTLLFLTMIALISSSAFANPQQINPIQVMEKQKNLEKDFDGKIGVYAIDTNNNRIIAYRANERFPVQSTMKLISVADLLKHDSDNHLLRTTIHYKKDDLIPWHPVTGKYINTGT